MLPVSDPSSAAKSSPPMAAVLPNAEVEITEALGRGDRRQALALCARHYGLAIGRLAMAFVGSQAEAEEIAQETLLQAYDALGTYRAEGTVRAFVFTIARRTCARALEQRARRDARLKLVESEVDAKDAGVLSAQREIAARVRRALERLKPSEREAVLLRFQSDLSFREVAEACGCDEVAARQRVCRALKRLREWLKSEESL